MHWETVSKNFIQSHRISKTTMVLLSCPEVIRNGRAFISPWNSMLSLEMKLDFGWENSLQLRANIGNFKSWQLLGRSTASNYKISPPVPKGHTVGTSQHPLHDQLKNIGFKTIFKSLIWWNLFVLIWEQNNARIAVWLNINSIPSLWTSTTLYLQKF